MLKKIKIFVVLTVVLFILGTIGWFGLGIETRNKIYRMQVSYMDGNYKVTYSNFQTTKEYFVKNGKITSEGGKGYYFFWAETQDGKKYIQVPIENTTIEEQ